LVTTTMNTVWVGNLPAHTSEDEVARVFSEQCGKVKEVTVRSKQENTFAFVKFADPLGFEHALRMRDSQPFGGTTPLKVNFVLGRSTGTRTWTEPWRDERGPSNDGGRSSDMPDKGKGRGDGGSWWEA